MRHIPTVLILSFGSALALGLLMAAPSDAAAGTEGFLYGEVETRSGNTYKGRLRWGDEEAFWGDFFNSSKDERPWAEEAPRRFRGRREAIEIFGVEIGSRWEDWDGGRQFIAPFGAIEELRIRGRGELTARMKGDFEIRLDGGSNDIGAKVHVWDGSLGEIALEWREIERIRFLPAPDDLDVGNVTRLYGTLHAHDGRIFKGWIQWDQDECLSTDELDGETRDGDVEIEMGRIRSIERRSRWGSNVVLRDGRSMVLEGTNDVDDDNRGIYVEDPKWGRVLVKWDAFDRLDFESPQSSGPAYGDYPPGKPLRGTVETRGGDKLSGRIVFDLDESESWEYLNGDYRDVEYSIPFYKIESIKPRGSRASLVTLRNGEEIELDDSADVDDGNDGIAIVSSGDTDYIRWRDVEEIRFD
ncbi:MAG: hypothetical protein MPN21_17475 [Thermoanaerobaculia bacterium]|nr:hypothetical protein [Thermoanaerobaculia bacterium]